MRKLNKIEERRIYEIECFTILSFPRLVTLIFVKLTSQREHLIFWKSESAWNSDFWVNETVEKDSQLLKFS